MSENLELAVKYFINELQPDPLKLQKLLYFAQGISFRMTGEELFEEDFQAWPHGPVVPSVYKAYKNYGDSPIKLSYVITEIREIFRTILDYVCEIYGKYDGRYLLRLTYAQTPWLNARKDKKSDEPSNEIILKNDISPYFATAILEKPISSQLQPINGHYLNPDNSRFTESVNSEIYIDKSMLITQTNKLIKTEQKYICVSRPRRFGKSIAAEMLCAYYSCNCDSREIFKNLKIAKSDSFEKHLNQYNVIKINMHDFWETSKKNTAKLIEKINVSILKELSALYANVDTTVDSVLIEVLSRIYNTTKIPFIVIIDEWDCIFRDVKNDKESQESYLGFLRLLLKDKTYVGLAYMTGILPIKKYGTHSMLNMFTEISMLNTGDFAEFTGFTESEVKRHCEKYDMDMSELRHWYNGYNVDDNAIYNPRSIVEAMRIKKYDNYWTQTETFEALQVYIDMNYEGLRDNIIKLISGESIKINTRTFTNDMVTFAVADDILTLLVHLGYLTYDEISSEVSIPNYEIVQEFIAAITVSKWTEVIKLLEKSEELLQATWAKNETRIAEIIESVHETNTSVLQYNDENSLSCTITLAYYAARRYYFLHRELHGGKGFADIVFIPTKLSDKPAMIIELKWDKNAETAITQIKSKSYISSLEGYKGEVLLVGINYNKNNKKHECRIESVFI